MAVFCQSIAGRQSEQEKNGILNLFLCLNSTAGNDDSEDSDSHDEEEEDDMDALDSTQPSNAITTTASMDTPTYSTSPGNNS